MFTVQYCFWLVFHYSSSCIFINIALAPRSNSDFVHSQNMSRAIAKCYYAKMSSVIVLLLLTPDVDGAALLLDPRGHVFLTAPLAHVISSVALRFVLYIITLTHLHFHVYNK